MRTWVMTALLLVLVPAGKADEIVHEGKTLSEWVKQLEDRDGKARAAAGRAIGVIGPKAKAAVPDLVKALKDGDNGVRWAAAFALSRMGPAAKAAIPALEELLKDKAKDVRYMAANALGSMGEEGKAAVPALCKALRDDDAWMRWHCTVALGSIGDKKATGPLTAALDDDEYIVRKGAIEALERLGPAAKDSVPALLRKWRDRNDYDAVQKAAAKALKKIDPEAARKAGVP